MPMHALTKERGASVLSLVLLAIIVGFLAMVLAQTVPTYFEYLAIQKAVKAAGQAQTPEEARERFEKAAQIDDFKSISSQDLTIDRVGNQLIVSFSYEKEIPLVQPVSLLIKYRGSSEK